VEDLRKEIIRLTKSCDESEWFFGGGLRLSTGKTGGLYLVFKSMGDKLGTGHWAVMGACGRESLRHHPIDAVIDRKKIPLWWWDAWFNGKTRIFLRYV
jgi:hypothetical protein